MFFAQRTIKRIGIVFGFFLVYAILTVIAASVFAPVDKSFASSLSYWAFRIPVGLFAYIALELLSIWFFELTNFKRLPSWVQVL